MSSSVAARKMRMAISPLLAAMSFFIWRLGASASVLLVVAHRRRRRVERIILTCLVAVLSRSRALSLSCRCREHSHLLQLCSTPGAARDTVSPARKLRPVPLTAPVHSPRPRMPLRVAAGASSTIFSSGCSRWGIWCNGPELGTQSTCAKGGEARRVENQHSKGLAYPSYHIHPRRGRHCADNVTVRVEHVPG